MWCKIWTIIKYIPVIYYYYIVINKYTGKYDQGFYIIPFTVNAWSVDTLCTYVLAAGLWGADPHAEGSAQPAGGARAPQ